MTAFVFRKVASGLLACRPNGVPLQKVQKFSTSRTWTKGQKLAIASGLAIGGTSALLFALNQSSISASGTEVHPTALPWNHKGLFSALDHASIRRGYEVYKQVCAACHSMQYLAYRNLVGVSHTEAEAKAEAAEIMVQDGPDDAGNYYMRPGKLSDYFPSPYPNEEAARAVNNGSYPPDLSYIALARHGGEDYLFALLTGYVDPPAGVAIGEGQYYNPYFPGGAISMAQVLYNDAAVYSDGTPASASQLAKDVSTFLVWAADPCHDERKRMGIKSLGIFLVLGSLAYYIKRHKWAALKTRKISFHPRQE